MTLIGAIKQLHDLRSAEDMPSYYKPCITEVINVLLMGTQEARHGYWIDVNGDGSLWRCSACGETQCCDSNYCGECGTKMDSPKPIIYPQVEGITPTVVNINEVKEW